MGEDNKKDMEALLLVRRHLKGLLIGIETLIANTLINKKTGQTIEKANKSDQKGGNLTS